jgi:hypothetical protein
MSEVRNHSVPGNSLQAEKKPMANEGVPRLILNAFCTTCGNISEEDESIAVAQFALDHVATTTHVVVLNGTADVVQDSDEIDPASLASAGPLCGESPLHGGQP